MLSPIWGILIVFVALTTAWVLQKLSPYYINIARSGTARFSQIDGLRGYLSLAVFLTHALSIRLWFETGEWTWPLSRFYFLCGTGPVSLFFMITGFLFWGKAIDRNSSGLRFSDVIGSRLRRLAPLYLFAIIPMLLIVAQRTTWHLHVEAYSLGFSILQWVVCGLGGRPDINGLDKTWAINPAVWTLWYEWAFYLSLPVLSRFAGPIGTALISGIVIAAVCFYLNAEFVVLNFVVGAALAHAARYKFRGSSILRSRGAAIVAIGFVALILVTQSLRYGALHTALLTPLFVIVTFGNSLFGALCWAPARLLGAISYSIYLLHCLLLQVVMHIVNAMVPLVTLSAIEYWAIVSCICVALVLLSSITYRWIENPWMQIKPPAT